VTLWGPENGNSGQGIGAVKLMATGVKCDTIGIRPGRTDAVIVRGLAMFTSCKQERDVSSGIHGLPKSIVPLPS